MLDVLAADFARLPELLGRSAHVPPPAPAPAARLPEPVSHASEPLQLGLF
jgi:hypothetical protein